MEPTILYNGYILKENKNDQNTFKEDVKTVERVTEHPYSEWESSYQKSWMSQKPHTKVESRM